MSFTKSLRSDNLAVAVRPAQSVPASAGSSTTCELSDADWVAEKYTNFRLFVHSLAPQEPKLADWSDWLKTIPLAVFLAGGDCELKGVREALTDKQRAAEALLVLERWALQYSFEVEKINPADILRITRYILLFATC